MVECRTVSSRRDLDEWIAFTDRLYAGTPQHVPPLRQQLRDFHARKAPYFRSGDIELLSIVRDESVVARTTAHTNAKLDAKLAERQLLFGFTEFVDEEEVFAELLGALEARARRIGATRLFGPVNLLPNQSGGVVTSGYERARVRRQPVQPRVLPSNVRAARLRTAVRGRDVRARGPRSGRDARRGALPVRRGAHRAGEARDQAREQATHEAGARVRAPDAERELRAARVLHRDRRGRVRLPGGWPRLPDRRANRALPVQGRRAGRVRSLRPGHLRVRADGERQPEPPQPGAPAPHARPLPHARRSA